MTDYVRHYITISFPEEQNYPKDLEFINSTSSSTDSEVLKDRTKRIKMIMYRSNLGKYLSKLLGYLRENSQIGLRQMLSLTGEASNSEFAAELFPKFILGKGYDGLISIEGGDDTRQKNPTSFVFFNLTKIGTYESWHPKP